MVGDGPGQCLGKREIVCICQIRRAGFFPAHLKKYRASLSQRICRQKKKGLREVLLLSRWLRLSIAPVLMPGFCLVT
jgi:hypothetical protein